MQRTTYVLNCNDVINCDKIVEQLKDNPGHVKSPVNPYGHGTEFSESQQNENIEMYNNWVKWGYVEHNSIEWINYYLEKDLASIDFTALFDLLKVTVKHTWISSIRPGKCIAWHRDIESQEKQWSEEGELVRYTVFLTKPEPGHFFVVNDQSFHMTEQGSVYKWITWDDYHLGSNVGSNQKYLLHIIGLQH